jgi:diguanylate cyclase (GGDEF)-like protein/PAS domain S-box-containing protein
MEAKKIEPFSIKELFEQQYGDFTRAFLDAWAVIDENGKLVKNNLALSTITGMKSKEMLKAKSFDDCLKLELDGRSFSIKNILKYTEPGRIDEVIGSSEGHKYLNLIIGYYPFYGDSKAILGAFILLRDVTAETQLQGKYVDKSKQSVTDKLTNLHNRHYLEQAFPKLIEDAEASPENSQNSKISVVMFDIDKFKSINDGYGHQAGDFIIAKIANIIKESFRKSDIVCRYGGEEFIAVLPASTLAEAGKVAEKIRRRIELETFVWENEQIPNSISIGIAELHLKGEKNEQVIARADAALYKAKHSGRNRVMVHRGGELIVQFTLDQDIKAHIDEHRNRLALKKSS